MLLILMMVSLATLSKRAASTIINGTIEKSLIVNPEAVQRTLIWMHGLGDTNHGFADIFQQVAPPSIRVVLLHAPTMPVTINGGMEMPSWYDIKDFSRTSEDSEGIKRSAMQINECIKMEIDRMKTQKQNDENDKCEISASSNVFIGGFSQGAAMAVYNGYHYHETLGGVIALSGYVLQTANYPNEIHDANKDTSCFACHGEMDPVVPLSYSQQTFDQSLKGHIKLKYEKWPNLQHEVHPNEIQKVCQFVMNGGNLNELTQSKL